MGGNAIYEKLETALPSDGVRTVVLVGRTGNGRSATGNSILGRKAFKSKVSSSGVASTCELQQTVMEDGQIINVIDTPGLFDFAGGSEFVGKEIVKCIEMAKNGIHAFLVVFSVRSRFSQEEAAALRTLQTLFGDEIIRYMIIVFTGGNELEDNDETLEDYLGRECPQPLKELLTLCGNRRVLFNNKTKDELERVKKVRELLSLVDTVIAQNGGRSYSDELFSEFQEGAMKLRGQQKDLESLRGYAKREISQFKVQIEKLYDEPLERITEMVESKLRETITKIEKQLGEEQSSRLKAEEVAQLAQMRSDDEIRELRENLERARKEAEEQSVRLKAGEVAQPAQNGGRPYSDELFTFESFRGYAKSEISRFKVQIEKLYEEPLERITEMVESKLRETITWLEKQLGEELSARLKVEEAAQLAQKRSNDEIRKLHGNLEKARKETEEQFARLKAEEQSARLKAEEIAQLAQKRLNDEFRKLHGNLERARKEAEEQFARLKAEEQSARLKAEEVAQLAQKRSNDEIPKLRENLERARKETEEQSLLKANEHSARREAEKVAQLKQSEIRLLRDNLERERKETAELRKNLERVRKETKEQSLLKVKEHSARLEAEEVAKLKESKIRLLRDNLEKKRKVTAELRGNLATTRNELAVLRR